MDIFCNLLPKSIHICYPQRIHQLSIHFCFCAVARCSGNRCSTSESDFLPNWMIEMTIILHKHKQNNQAEDSQPHQELRGSRVLNMFHLVPIWIVIRLIISVRHWTKELCRLQDNTKIIPKKKSYCACAKWRNNVISSQNGFNLWQLNESFRFCFLSGFKETLV